MRTTSWFCCTHARLFADFEPPGRTYEHVAHLSAGGCPLLQGPLVVSASGTIMNYSDSGGDEEQVTSGGRPSI